MQNKTALIVDDSRTACQMLRLMLEREEFQVDVLDNPETVNFIHRVLGLLTLGAIFDLWRLCRRHVEGQEGLGW